MEKFQFSVTMVRTLKGAPLSCLLIMAMMQQPVTAQYLERTSGYSDKSVNAALLLLEDYGFVSRNGRYSWQICAGVKQLPLMDLMAEVKEASTADGQEAEDEPANEQDKLDINGGTRRNSDSESENFRLPTSSSRSLNLGSTENPQLLIKSENESENFRVRDNLAECDRFGIREPKRSSLSSLMHVTPNLIHYQCKTAPNIGLAIYRIENNWPIKDSWVDPDAQPAVCAQSCDPQPEEKQAELPAEAILAWENAKKSLQESLPRSDFKTWVANVSLVAVDLKKKRIFKIRTGNPVAAEWLKKNAVKQLEKLLNAKVRISW